MKKLLLLTGIFVLVVNLLFSQTNQGLYHFSFKPEKINSLENISKIISIDNYSGGIVEAYASPAEWEKFQALGIDYEIIPPSTKNKVINMATTVDEMVSWDRYPTYEVYVQMMEQFADDYPNLCQLEEIGTLNSGRKLLALKISDNVSLDNEPEPELFYTSSMHGDELTGAILMLRLTDYLLSNYNNAAYPQVTTLVNNAEIWINPLANPDGSYYGGNSTVASSRRYNANSVDINRNFPDPQDGEHPDGNAWQEETILMMEFAENHHFALSANFHGGIEVVNYPWDTWSKLTADDDWWQYVSREYADLAQANSPAGYMTALTNGITNGYTWYEVAGGRQDYMNYIHHCREVTIELSDVKLISSDELPAHWDYNKEALLTYLSQGLNGVRGVVTDGQGNPLNAKVTIANHDMDNSWVTTDPRAGDYARYLKAGIYDITFSAEGFVDYVAENVEVVDGQTTTLDVAMGLPEPALDLNKTQFSSDVVLDESKTESLIISNVGYADLNFSIDIENEETNTWLSLTSDAGVISPGESQTVGITLDASGREETSYSCNLFISGDSSVTIPVTMNVYTTPKLEVNANSFNKTILINNQQADTLILSNTGNADLNYTLSITNEEENLWLTLNNNSGIITPASSKKIALDYWPEISGTGLFSTKVVVGGDIPASIPVTLQVDTIPYFKTAIEQFEFEKLIGETESQELLLKNQGGDTLEYQATIEYSQGNHWIMLNDSTGTINKGKTDTLSLSVDCSALTMGDYQGKVVFTSEYDTIDFPVYLLVDTLPELWVNKTSVVAEAFEGSTSKDTLFIGNLGGGSISFTPQINYANSNQSWAISPISEVNLNARDTLKMVYTFDARNLLPGKYTATVLIGPEANHEVSIEFTVIALPELDIDVYSINKDLIKGQLVADTFVLKNKGGGTLTYNAKTNIENTDWLLLNKTEGSISAESSDTIVLTFDATNTIPGEYSGKFIITTNKEYRIPVSMHVEASPVIYLSNNELSFGLPVNESAEKTIRLTNRGGSTLEFSVELSADQQWLTLNSPESGTLSEGAFTDLLFNASAVFESNTTVNETVLIKTNVGDSTLNIAMEVLVGTKSDKGYSINVYPNPFTQQVYFNWPKANPDHGKLIIYNSIGKQVVSFQEFTNHQNWNGAAENGKNLPAGTYFYQVIVNDEIISGKLLKNN